MKEKEYQNGIVEQGVLLYRDRASKVKIEIEDGIAKPFSIYNTTSLPGFLTRVSHVPDFILPENCRYYSRDFESHLFVIEQKPCTRTLKISKIF